MEHNNITETEKMLSMSTAERPLTPSYLDDELMIMDNVKLLGIPNVVRPSMNIIAICTKGKMQLMMNGEAINVHANNIFICPPETPLADAMFSPDFEYTALCVSNRVLQLYLRNFISVWNEFTYIKKLNVIDLADIDMLFFEKIYSLLALCIQPQEDEDEQDKMYKAELLKGYISASLVALCNLLRKQTKSTMEQPRQNISLFNQFLQMLQTAEVKHRTVDYYASELCISPKYLTVICKKNSGRTANDWIREYTLTDITYHLQNTDMSIKEISHKLGFPNASFFGKYVKDHLGCTPLEHRAKK